MKTSIATVSISGDLREKLAAIAAAGFDGVEIFENDFLSFDGTPGGSRPHGPRPRARDHAVPAVPRLRGHARAAARPRLRPRRAQIRPDGGARHRTDAVCSNVSPLALGGIDRAAADFRELGERAATRGLRVGYEALAWGRHVNDHRDAWEIVRRADHPNIGLILDSFHTLARRIDVDSIRSIPGDRIFIVQLADAPLIDMDLLYWSRHFRNMPGQGDLPVLDFIARRRATGYDGPLSLEIFNDQFRGGSPKSIAVDGRRSLISLMDQVRRGPSRDLADPAPASPTASRVHGVEFVEFAADEPKPKRCAGTVPRAWASPKPAGTLSKDVTLFRQGGINLVINTEKRGLRPLAPILRTAPAPMRIGLKVENAAATVERAPRRSARSPSSSAVGPGELADSRRSAASAAG